MASQYLSIPYFVFWSLRLILVIVAFAVQMDAIKKTNRAVKERYYDDGYGGERYRESHFGWLLDKKRETVSEWPI